MDKKLANKIWKTFVNQPSMTIQPKGRHQLRPAIKPVNFLGSVESYKQKFMKAMEGFELNDISIRCDVCKEPLKELGGLLFSPPKDNIVKKLHLCVACHKKTLEKFDEK